jgi:hypothetical protein
MIRAHAQFGHAPAALLIALTAACATSSTASAPAAGAAPAAPAAAPADSGATYADFIRTVQMRYPADSYIVGTGAGDSPDQAEEHARIEAAAAISSQIRANLKAIESESSANGQHITAASVSDEMVQEVATDAGAFIQPVRELTSRVGKGYEAVAIADRAQLDEKYAGDAARLLEKVQLAWDRALASAASADQMGAVTALCDAQTQEAALDKIDRERQLVTRRTAWTPEAVAKRHQVEELRSKLKGARVAVYQPKEVEGLEVSDAIVRRLGAAGYDAGLAHDTHCSNGDLVITVALDNTCGASVLGQRCEAALTASSQRCGSAETLFDEHSDKVTALHATDAALAEKAAIRKLDTKRFVDTVAGRVLTALEGGCRK